MKKHQTFSNIAILGNDDDVKFLLGLKNPASEVLIALKDKQRPSSMLNNF